MVIKKARRRQVFCLDGNRCLGCGSSRDLEIDHIVPQAAGGPNCWNNLQTLCRPCNQGKTDRPLDYRSPERRLKAARKCGCGWTLPLVLRPFGETAEPRESIWETCGAVERHADRLGGRWVFAGTWLPIAELFEKLNDGVTLEEFLDLYEGIDRSDAEWVIARQVEFLRDIPIVWLDPPPNRPTGSFDRWAVGNLVDNVNRGLYAEWLVGQALGIIGEGDHRTEWDWCDLRYRDVTIEVKASGLSQTWNPERQSTPRFDISPRRSAWNADTEQWRTFDPPQRLANFYVFCLHRAIPATIKDVQDPQRWTFWVVPTRWLDKELGGQKSVGVATLNRLTRSVDWEAIPAVLSLLIDGD